MQTLLSCWLLSWTVEDAPLLDRCGVAPVLADFCSLANATATFTALNEAMPSLDHLPSTPWRLSKTVAALGSGLITTHDIVNYIRVCSGVRGHLLRARGREIACVCVRVCAHRRWR